MFSKFKFNKKALIGLIILIIVGGLAAFYFFQVKNAEQANPSYGQVYRLVAEKISQSALIVVNLPPKTNAVDAQKNIVFTPQLQGNWVKAENNSQLIFKPSAKLNIDRYYKVALALENSGTIQADFLAVEDPKVIAIFPAPNSETSETSKVTIVFNRPMVPLTTLGFLEGNSVPVEINPATEGRFKWITTRNLQFIPKEALKKSSNYEVKVKAGMLSADGLPVEEFKSTFVTKKLAYLDVPQNEIVYDQPVSFRFNQPVDLERMKKEISLRNTITGKEIPFIAEYASVSADKIKSGEVVDNSLISKIKRFFARMIRRISGSDSNMEILKTSDKSVIQIYNAKDSFGREKIWDYNANYSVSFDKAYPLEGDIDLNENHLASISIGDPIKNVQAESARSSSVSQEFFDPQGKAWFGFYEEVDLTKSKIQSSKIKESGYGEKCKNENDNMADKPDCEKITDKKKIYYTFKSEEIGLGEKNDIVFADIVNMSGLKMNKDRITESLIAYPAFSMVRSEPSNSANNTLLTEIFLCSTTPIAVPSEKEMRNHLSANHNYALNYWQESQLVNDSNSVQYLKCDVGRFSTRIAYGLDPQTNYNLEFKLDDVFGQKINYFLNFTTGLMRNENLSFYNLQELYSVTMPGKTKLTYAAQNMEYVNMELCKLEPLDFAGLLETGINYFTPPGAVSGCVKTIKDKIELPKRYWVKNYFNVNINKYFPSAIGHYILTFSNPNHTARKWEKGMSTEQPVYERTYLTVTNLGLVEKRINLNSVGMSGNETLPNNNDLTNLYWVTGLSSLEPISGVKIDRWQKKDSSYRLLDSYNTDEKGVVVPKALDGIDQVIASYGSDSAIILKQETNLNYGSPARSASRIYLYTDKPIYQPSQTVFFKGLFRIGYDGNYEIFRGKKINLKGFNSKGDEIYNTDLDVSDYGTFNAEFVLDKASPLGSYRVCAENYNCAYFEIQEYVSSPFKVDLKADKEEYISKDTANIAIDADYYFGVPLDGGKAEYSVSSQDYYFDRFSDGYFDFGSGWYYDQSYSYGDKFISKGAVDLSKDGKAKITQDLNLETLFPESDTRRSKIIVVDVAVKNSSGQSVSAQKSFIVHAGEFYLGITSDRYYTSKNENIKLKIKSVDTHGKPVGIQNITGKLYQINWVDNKRQEATGGYASRWEKQRKEVGSFQFNTDAKGDYSKSVSFAEEGEYEAEIVGQDSRGNSIKSVLLIYIYGSKEVSIQPREGTELELDAKKTALNVGDSGEIIIKSPYTRAKALIAIERGKIFSYEIKEIQGNIFSYSFNVRENYSPNFYVSALLISDKPEIKFGQKEFTVDTNRQKLNIEVKSDKQFYLPGEEVTLNINTADFQGKRVEAEVSAAVVDLSVLALQGNPKKNPITFFYGGFPLTVATYSNIKNILVEKNIVETKGGSGGGGNDLENKKRGVFKETAFWQAAIRTDQNGRATAKFTLPDNLTAWQAETLGITKNTAVGVNYTEFTTKKQLMVVPLKPRFIVPGDEFSVGAQIFNQTNIKQDISLQYSSNTLGIKNDQAIKQITIQPNQSATIYYNVQAPVSIENGAHIFIFAAKGQGAEDTVEQSINITRNDTYEATATADYTGGPATREYVFLPDNIIKDKGSLTVKSSATLAVFMSDALKYLLEYPYGCAEQISSKLNSIAVIKRGLNLPNVADKFNLGKIIYNGQEYTIEQLVEIGLAKLYNNQRSDGGFALWQDYGDSNFYTTLQVVETLNNLKKAGYQINENSLSRSAGYLYGKITSDQNFYQDKNNLILTSYVLFSLEDSRYKNDNMLNQKINDLANDNLFINEKISNTSLSYLGIMAGGNFGNSYLAISKDPLKKKILDTLDNRINIDSRGSFLETNKNFLWYYYETPVKNTALYLKALVANKSTNPIADKVLRWLLASRQKDGAWGSTNNTITVVDAMTDFLSWKRETESDFILDLAINGKQESLFHFERATILDQITKDFSLGSLKFNENNTILFTKENKNNLPNNFYYDMSLKYYLPQDAIAPRDEGFSITRNFYAVDDLKNQNPLKEAKVGDVLREHLVVTVSKSGNFVGIEDFIPAGMEIVNLDLATEQKSLLLQDPISQGMDFSPNFKELRNDRAFLYRDNIPPGVYEFDYYTRALIKGKFAHLPAVISEMYFPENFGRTGGGYFEIK